MLRTILSISGRPGLYKLVNQGKNMLIVESLSDGKRIPAYARDKVISLGDVAIYTSDGEDTPLSSVFESIKTKLEGKPVDIKKLEKEKKMREFFGEVLPDFDDERVNTSDIKKVYQWYNILTNADMTDFLPKEEAEEEKESEEKEDKE